MVTERIESLTRNHRTIRDPDKLTYFLKIGGLAVGGYERNPKLYRARPIPEGHEFKLMSEDVDHFEQLMMPAIERIPALETVGVRQWFNGIEAFTEDGSSSSARRPSFGISLSAPASMHSESPPPAAPATRLQLGFSTVSHRSICGAADIKRFRRLSRLGQPGGVRVRLRGNPTTSRSAGHTRRWRPAAPFG